MKKYIEVASASRAFEVSRIICVGRNYRDHALEMGVDPEREDPFFFFKPVSSLCHGNQELLIPKWTESLDYEVEMVIALAKGGSHLDKDSVGDLIAGLAVGLDLTDRERQTRAKFLGHPWCMAKGFDNSAPCSKIVKLDQERLYDCEFLLSVNGSVVQRGNTKDMIWQADELIAKISEHIELLPGDLIYTGTPSGVGPLIRGDQLEAKLIGTDAQINARVC